MDFKEYITTHDLPTLESLERDLGKLSFDDDDDIIIELIKSLRDKMSKFIDFLEDLLQPDSSLVSMQEASILSEEQSGEVYALFKKIISSHRKYLSVYLDSSEDEKIVYFKELFVAWQGYKVELKPFIELTHSSWSTSTTYQDLKQNYFG